MKQKLKLKMLKIVPWNFHAVKLLLPRHLWPVTHCWLWCKLCKWLLHV